VDFLLVLIEVFSVSVTAELLRAKKLKIGNFAPTWSLWSKIQGVAPTNHFCTVS